MHLLRLFAFVALLAATLTTPARALSLLRDPDIEYALNQLAAPVLKAAGLSPSRVDILVIDDRRLNAFVVDQNSIFIHSGLLLKMKTAAMLQAVFAHEAAHIANGHLVRRPIAARNARTAAGLGAALGAAAAIAAGGGKAAPAIALGAQSTAQRLFFVHTRAEESAADQSGLRFMARAGIDPQGAVEVMDIFRGQEALSASRQDPYARTHPLSADRYRVVNRLAAGYAGNARKDPQADYWFARAKSKLSAFQRSPKWTLTRAGEYGYADVKLMRQAVAYHRQSNLKRALGAIDKAIATRPKDPYLHELRGQILIESRQFKAAVAAYGRAASLAPKNALILGAYGRALLADGQVSKAQQFLEKSRSRDGRDDRVVRDLAAAYARQGNKGMAAVLTAERYAIRGQLADAGIHAQRATDLLPRGSAAWQRAQDVLSAAQAAKKKK
ncbi:M48 family metalloprotease [Roseovarius litorisediminis]|nr:M48 family metalloprotease [Roseovarius litorisediminis]